MAEAKSAMNAASGRGKAWKKLKTALQIDEKGKCWDVIRKKMAGFVNLGFLLVLVGCELDLYGFLMAYGDYWSMNQPIVQILLIVCPLGYFVSVGMYMWLNSGTIEKLTKEPEDSGPNPYEDPSARGAGSSRPGKPTMPHPLARFEYANNRRTPFEMQFFHFLPVFRYYLVVKEREEVDIEAIFRVNSLSSFTLGIAQICGLIFQTYVAQLPMTIFTQINVVSQSVNWSITLLYFLTSISSQMQGSIRVSTLAANNAKDLFNIYEKSLKILTEAKRSDPEKKPLMQKQYELCVEAVEDEIRTLSKMEDVDLSDYHFKIKIDALRLLREKEILTFGQIS